MEIKWNIKFSKILRGWGFSILVALLIGTSVKSAIADWNDIPSGSMEPTILVGDRIFVNKLAYDLKVPYTSLHLAKWSDPKRGDIVVFYSPKDGKRLIKRVEQTACILRFYVEAVPAWNKFGPLLTPICLE